jgi:hypothetical protein
LALIAAEVPDGALLVDCFQALDLPSCLQLSALGYKGVVRYVDNLTAREVEWIAEDAHMGLMLVKTCRRGGWTPTVLEGTADGQALSHAAAVLGLPKGVSAWIDLEGSDGTADAEAAYCNAAFAEMSYCLAGIYVGAGCHMDAFDLYHNLTCSRYWKSGSNVPTPADRGYCLKQVPPLDRVLEGLPGRVFDVDIAWADAKSGRATWAIAP